MTDVSASFERIAICLIDVPGDRLRQVKPWRVETLAREIDGGQPQHPINVAAEEGGRYTLISGATRLAAVELGGSDAIDARVIPAASLTPERRRLLEITENINREELTKLERAENLAELKRVHEALYPAVRNGGDRRSAKARAARADQNEIFAFSSQAAEMTGLSRRAIELAVAMVSGLTPASKARLRGTWLEDHQAGLKLLAEQDGDIQARMCDLIFADPPQAASVGEALTIAKGGRVLSAPEKLFSSTLGNWSRLSARQRADFLDAQEDAVKAHARARGWFK